MLFVGLGGIFGAMTRFLLGKWVASRIKGTFPLGTWIINLTGSFALGILAALHMRESIPDWTWLLLGTGFLGAYTTFSTFGYEIQLMLRNKETAKAARYASTSVVLGILLAYAGWALAA
ncbi:fluoride efflux transporter CrcB [Paenibacillus sp. HB172176]|uniref:fluoride efflux transporter CrcB n=1 Tax=Paenibacillus sp. HB172176 TaxID=2493690 RepID=UPI00143B3E38|nr:fluoride efflux transporter CrcB [Paenibacillus sp. HB172176]